jgi:hypothetical protein
MRGTYQIARSSRARLQRDRSHVLLSSGTPTQKDTLRIQPGLQLPAVPVLSGGPLTPQGATDIYCNLCSPPRIGRGPALVDKPGRRLQHPPSHTTALPRHRPAVTYPPPLLHTRPGRPPTRLPPSPRHTLTTAPMPRTARDRDLAFAEEKLRRTHLGVSAFQDFPVEVLAALCARHNLHAEGACKRDYIDALYAYVRGVTSFYDTLVLTLILQRQGKSASHTAKLILPSALKPSAGASRKRTHEHVADTTPGPSKRTRFTSSSDSSSGSSRESTPTLSTYCGSPTPTPGSMSPSPHLRLGSLPADAERCEPISAHAKAQRRVLIPGPPPSVPVVTNNAKYAGYFRIGNAVFVSKLSTCYINTFTYKFVYRELHHAHLSPLRSS